MAIVKTHLFNISFEHNDLMKVLIKINHLDDGIYLEDSKKIVSNVKGVSLIEGNPYDETLEKINNILEHLNINKDIKTYHDEEIDLVYTNEILDDIKKRVLQIEDVKNKIVSESIENKEALTLLKNIDTAKLNIDQLSECEFLVIRFGKIPINEVMKLDYYEENNFIFEELSRDKQYVWGVYLGVKNNISEVDNIFSSMSFEEILLPHFVHGTVDTAISELNTEINTMDQYAKDLDDRINKIVNKNTDSLLEIYTNVSNLKKLYDKCKHMIDFNHKMAFYAFSKYDLKEIEDIFKDIKSIRVLELPNNIYTSRQITSPVIRKNNKLVKPFENVIKPKSGDRVDVTSFIAIIFMIASIVLIGDIGLGIIVIILGFIFKGKNFGAILQRIGFGILLGGLVYGTVFHQYELYNSAIFHPLSLVNGVEYWFALIAITVVILLVIKWLTREKVKA